MNQQDPKATVHFAGEDLFIGITPSGHAQALDTNHERASAATPMELLLIALGSCTAVDVISILRKKRQQVTSIESSARMAREASAQITHGVRQAGAAHVPRSMAQAIDFRTNIASPAKLAPPPRSLNYELSSTASRPLGPRPSDVDPMP